MSSLEIIVPGSPRGKGRPRVAGAGHVYTPDTTARYENLVALAARDAMKAAGLKLFEGPLAVSMWAYMFIPQSWPIKRQFRALTGIIIPTSKPDHDNIAKMLDGMNKIVWVDDAQIAKFDFSKLYSSQPKLVVRVQHYFDMEGIDDA